MQRHLRALTASLPAVPGDAETTSAFLVSAEAIEEHLFELREQVVRDEDDAAPVEAAALLRCTAAAAQALVPIRQPFLSQLAVCTWLLVPE